MKKNAIKPTRLSQKSRTGIPNPQVYTGVHRPPWRQVNGSCPRLVAFVSWVIFLTTTLSRGQRIASRPTCRPLMYCDFGHH